MNIWLRYFVFWLGMEPIGDPKEADIVIVQAFGRNSFIDDKLFEVRRIFDEAGSDLIAIKKLQKMKFADKKTFFDPGISNRILVHQCGTLVERYNIPAIVQWEIAAAFDPHWYWAYVNKIFCIWPSNKPGEYFSTHDLNKQAIEIMKQKGFRRPIVLAHNMHMTRAFLVTEKLLKENFDESSAIVAFKGPDFFDPDSVQWFTTNKYFWLFREGLTRIHYLLKGWV